MENNHKKTGDMDAMKTHMVEHHKTHDEMMKKERDMKMRKGTGAGEQQHY